MRQDRQGLVDYLNNDNLRDVPMLKLPGDVEVVVFEDVMENMLLQSPSTHFLDSYGVRHLVMTPPARFQVLSGLLMGPGKYLQRVGVTSPTGEECVLNVVMAAAQAAAPAPAAPSTAPTLPSADLSPLDAAATPSSHYMSAAAAAPPSGAAAPASGVSQEASPTAAAGSTPGGAASAPAAAADVPLVWRLSSVRGEPQVHGQDCLGPSPEMPPEVVVESQLAAMKRRDFGSAFEFLSPGSRKVVGGLQQFTANVSKHRRYSALLGHIGSTSVRRCQTSATMYMEIVAATSASGTRFVFCYILSRQVEEGPYKDCWLIEFIKVVDDPKLLAAVDMSCAVKQRDDKRKPDQK